MSHRAPQSAISVLPPQIAAAPSQVRLTMELLGEAASRTTLAQLNAAMSELRGMAVQPMLRRAIAAIEKDDYATGGEWALKALQQDERSGLGWYLLGVAREQAGDFASSINAYEAALALLPDHDEVANNLGRLAYRMGMLEQAEKLFRLFLGRYPGNAEAANNLSCAVREQDRPAEAIEILRPAIMANPGVAMLWNSMGTVVADDGDFPTADVFFQEAIRLDPIFPKARYNHGNALLAQGEAEAALQACDAALGVATSESDREMMRLARSTILLTLGRLGEGWDEYESRLHPQYPGVTHFAVERPRWEPGMDISGKSLLIIGEQGLGDEILFANILPDVIEKLGPDGKLSLAVEPRLIPFFQRSFPEARVGAHITYMIEGRHVRVAPFVDNAAIDVFVPMASLLREHRRAVADFPVRRGYMKADPSRVAHWRAELAKAPQGKKIGLLWKSAIQKNTRNRYYSPFADWSPVLKQPGAVFVNLQYGDCSEEISHARRELGVELWTPPGIDLKQDLDDIAALSCALDLVVGFSNATFNIAAACGAPAWLISTPGAWTRLGTPDYPWYPQTRIFMPPAFREWGPVMRELADAVRLFATER